MGFHIQLRVNLVKSRKHIKTSESRLLEVLQVKSKKKTQVPNCPGAEMSHTGAEVSWCRIVPVPKCLAFSYDLLQFYRYVSFIMVHRFTQKHHKTPKNIQKHPKTHKKTTQKHIINQVRKAIFFKSTDPRKLYLILKAL